MCADIPPTCMIVSIMYISIHVELYIYIGYNDIVHAIFLLR